MKPRILYLTVFLCLLLTGCSWFDGSYVHVTPHREQGSSSQGEAVSASNYSQLLSVLEGMVSSGTESGVINVANYDRDMVEVNMTAAVQYVRNRYPVGAYAVEQMEFEVGTNSGKPAIAVNVTYRHSRIEIQRIQKVETMEEAEIIIGEALKSYDAAVVLQVQEFQEMDFSQLVKDFAEEQPESIMETPQVTAGIYGSGTARVVELAFTYQNSRDQLRQMQSQVQPVFDSAALYVSGDGSDNQKYSQLYAFLMERFDYKQETSITPAYSLLRHGVGDSRAFAVVYASMCRRAGLECRIVTGTRNGEPWTWNMVRDGELYFHVDLLRSSLSGGFREYTDGEMGGYVWDYSNYPACNLPYVPLETETPAQTESADIPQAPTEKFE
ncbi:MAG: transglutaminase-like domain-containing protein [Oscillospiraceae bacterium]|nr:transglutaminase-like domain-containing protein [Oscillospiraceae bacterium]